MNNEKNTSENKQSHAPLAGVGGSPIFSLSDLKRATKLSWFEKICLWFIKPKYQVDELEHHTLKYKVFRGKIYVIDHWINPPKHWNCRCQVVPK